MLLRSEELISISNVWTVWLAVFALSSPPPSLVRITGSILGLEELVSRTEVPGTTPGPGHILAYFDFSERRNS